MTGRLGRAVLTLADGLGLSRVGAETMQGRAFGATRARRVVRRGIRRSAGDFRAMEDASEASSRGGMPLLPQRNRRRFRSGKRTKPSSISNRPPALGTSEAAFRRDGRPGRSRLTQPTRSRDGIMESPGGRERRTDGRRGVSPIGSRSAKRRGSENRPRDRLRGTSVICEELRRIAEIRATTG